MKRQHFFLFIFVILLFSGCDKQKSENKIIFGISSQYPPLVYIEEGEVKGFDIDLARIIGNKLNLSIEFEDMEFQSMFPAINSHKVDAGIGGISITEDRKKNFDFSIAYRFEDIALVFRKDDEIENIENMKQRKIGVQFGSTNSVWAKNQIEVNNIIEMDNVMQLVKALINRNIDGILTSKSHALVLEKNMLTLSWINLGKNYEGCGIMLKKNSPLIVRINKILNEMIENGEIDDLEKKWYL